jgi:hypothetical protein
VDGSTRQQHVGAVLLVGAVGRCRPCDAAGDERGQRGHRWGHRRKGAIESGPAQSTGRRNGHLGSCGRDPRARATEPADRGSKKEPLLRRFSAYVSIRRSRRPVNALHQFFPTAPAAGGVRSSGVADTGQPGLSLPAVTGRHMNSSLSAVLTGRWSPVSVSSPCLWTWRSWGMKIGCASGDVGSPWCR